MPALRENVAGKANIRTRHFAGIDALAERQGIPRVRTQIPYGSEAPPGQHLLHVLFQRCRWCTGRVSPDRLREMNVTVPESRNDGLAGTIDDAGVLRNRNVTAATDRGDDATGDDNDRIGERSSVR